MLNLNRNAAQKPLNVAISVGYLTSGTFDGIRFKFKPGQLHSYM
jgi:hypothetical protein